VSILSERRVYHPYGLAGGDDAECGLNYWVRRVPKVEGSDADAKVNGGKAGAKLANGDEASKQDEFEERYINMGAKNTASMKPGERIIVMTPGGGGWGPAGKASESKQSERQDPKHSWRGGSVASRQAEAEASA
jgi:5-oxoprolinase (ATP-hydrolysing)